jgi:hypothetical protein
MAAGRRSGELIESLNDGFGRSFTGYRQCSRIHLLLWREFTDVPALRQVLERHSGRARFDYLLRIVRPRGDHGLLIRLGRPPSVAT